MIRYYYKEKNKKELDTKIKNIIMKNDNRYVELEDSIFYPQGGGQKGDKGYIVLDDKKYNIKNTIKDENYNSILVMEDCIPYENFGKKVRCYLDWNFRYKQMRLHTALHIYHALIEEVKKEKINNPILSTIEDGYAINKYDENDFDINILDEVTKKFREIIKKNLKVITYPDKEKENFRYWRCGDYIIPCGGVHVDNLNEIDGVDIEIKHKKKSITVKIVLK